MGPRRMDGFARPSAPAAPQPQRRQAPVPPPPQPRVRQAAPVTPVSGPQRPVQPGYGRPQPEYAPEQMRAAQRRARSKKGSGGWRMVIQFIVGLLVIAGVAAAIVALYIRYYQ